MNIEKKRTPINIDKIIIPEIQRGEVTHHQDQFIFPVSFNIKNIKNKINFMSKNLFTIIFLSLLLYFHD
jgi:hypothetical protein